MKKVIMYAFTTVMGCLSFQCLAFPTYPTNMSFEISPQMGTTPLGWFASGFGYSKGSDTSSAVDGFRSARISAQANHGEFGTLSQCVSATQYRGRNIQLNGYIQTAGVFGGWAGLWMRVDDANGKVLALDNMRDHGITGTRNWNHYAIELPVAYEAAKICFGNLLVGDGTAWFDVLRLEIQ